MRVLLVFLLLAVVYPTIRSFSNAPADDADVSQQEVQRPSVIGVTSGETFRRSTINNAYYRVKTKTTATNLIAKELEGEAASDPACCSASPSATYCFIRSFDGIIRYKKVGKSGPWTSLKNWIVGAPSCVAHGSDVTVLYVEGNKHRIISNTVRNGKFLGSQLTDGYSPQEVPACVAMDADIACMYRGVYGLSFILHRIAGQWGPPLPQGGLLYSPVGLYYSPATKELNCYATNQNFHLQVYTKTAKTVTYWREVGDFVMTGRPTVCSHGDNTIDIFTLGPGSNLLWLRRDSSGKYLNWLNEKGNIAYPPTCLGAANRIDCFSVSPNYYMAKKIWRGSFWTKWEDVAWGYVGAPSCHFTDSTAKSISCYVRSVETSGIEAFTFHA